MLEAYIRRRLAEKEILLMTHIVIGYPSFEKSLEIINTMVAAGVDLMELQIPFSEPIADGPVILRANQQVLASGGTTDQCMSVAAEATRRCDIPFLFMSYYNVLYKRGIKRFAREMTERNMRGAIVPDLPLEEADDYLSAMQDHQLAPIFIFAPTTPAERMRRLAECGRGFIYCVARKGVTGKNTDFSDSLGDYLVRCRQATELPLALGFGVKDKDDIDFLKGRVDIAVIGTRTIRIIEDHGVEAAGDFIRSLQ
jgi:tryptophan synthase alpha chain